MDNKTLAIIGVIIAAIVIAAAVFVLINNNNGNNDGGGGGGADTSITIVDADGKTYTFDKPLGKVVLGYSGSGGPFTTMAAVLGNELPSHLVGIDNSLYKFREDVYTTFCNEVPGFKELPQVGGIGSDWDTKKIITMAPEAFITSIHHKSTVQANNVDTDLAKAGIPIFLLYGGQDQTVKPELNCEPFVERFKAVGGKIAVRRRFAYGHHPHGEEHGRTDRIAGFLDDATFQKGKGH